MRGEAQEEGEGRKCEAKAAHTAIWFLTSKFVLMPRGFGASWLRGTDQINHSSVCNRKIMT